MGEVEARDRDAKPSRHTLGKLAADPPVRSCLPWRVDGLAHPLHPSLGIGEGALLLGEGRGGQEDVGELGRLVHEQILDHQAVELAQGLVGVVEIGLGQHGVLPHHVHGADGAVEAAFGHLGDDEPGLARRPDAPRALEAREARRRVVSIARQIGGDGARVAAALDIVLATQRRDAGAREAHLTGGQREIEQRVRIGRPVRVLGDAHAPDQARAREGRSRVPARRPRDILSRHAGDLFGVLERVGGEGGGPGLEPFGARADEVEPGQPLVEDELGHGVEEGHVRAGAFLEPEIGLVAQLDPLGIDHDEPRAPADGLAEPDGDDGVVGRGVGAHHHETARLLVVLIGVGRGAGAHGGQHGLDGRGVAEPRAVVDVVGAHHHSRELLDDVAVLVGGLGRGEGPEAPVIAGQAIGGGLEGLVPADLAPRAVTLDHGHGDAVAGVDEARAEAALHAQRAEARVVLGHVVGHHGQPAVFAHLEPYPAPDAAIGARGLDLARDGHGDFLGAKRSCGAGRHALAARRADGG